MTREEALNEIRSWAIPSKTAREVLETLVPELAESEDERIRKWLVDYFKAVGKSWIHRDISPEQILAYLEKQKYDRMQPIYDNQESFESALDKAWKSYNDSGARTVDGCEDNYTECAYAKGFREGYLFGLEKQKEQKPSIFPPGLGEVRWNPISSAEWSYPYGRNETADRLVSLAECLEMDGDYLFNGYSGTECGKFLRELARKQLECKPEEWGEEDKKLIDDVINSLCCYQNTLSDYQKEIVGEEIRKLKLLKPQPKQEWSEEDEDDLKRVVRIVEENDSDWAELTNWLKSLPTKIK